MPGAEYSLYFVREELAAFNLLVVKEGAMVDKYFCMNSMGRKYNLYFLSWLENVRYCVEQGIALYHAGQGAEKTKARLGATSIPSLILFKHRRPAVDRFLMEHQALIEGILGYLGFWPAVPPEVAEDRTDPGRQEHVLATSTTSRWGISHGRKVTGGGYRACLLVMVILATGGAAGCAHRLYGPMQPDGWSAQPIAIACRFAPDADLDPATGTPVGDEGYGLYIMIDSAGNRDFSTSGSRFTL